MGSNHQGRRRAARLAMKAIIAERPGGPEVLVMREMPVPEVHEGCLLVKVRAAGINRPDIGQRMGRYPPPKGVTEVLGLEIAGEIVAVGANVKEWKLGDRCCALVAGGGYAEYCEAPAPQCLPVPKGMAWVQAAALPETFFTVWHNVFERGHLASGETILIHGGASGIGTTAIQLACAFGATVLATAGTDEKCKACEKLGARRAINYRSEDFVAVVSAFTEGRGVDVVLDMVAGPYAPRNLTCLAQDGRLIVIAVQGGTTAEIDFRAVLSKRATISGSTLRPQSVAQKGRIAMALLEKVWPLLESGRAAPVIYRTFPLEQAREAHALLESGEHIGKIVLEVA